jgi:hypothetical protein
LANCWVAGSKINLASDKLGKKYEERNAKLCTIIQKIAEGLTQFSTDADTLGDALRISDWPVRRRFLQEGGRVLHAAADF